MTKTCKCGKPLYSTSGKCFEHYTERRKAYQAQKRVERGGSSEARAYRKHGCTNEPWFRSYEAMMRRASGRHQSRCYDHVDVCAEWSDPRAFGAWATANGFAPGLTIDRIDAARGYSPENCRWIPLSENTSRTHETKPRLHDELGRFAPLAQYPKD